MSDKKTYGKIYYNEKKIEKNTDVIKLAEKMAVRLSGIAGIKYNGRRDLPYRAMRVKLFDWLLSF